jgi:hypothetical protein
MEIFLSAIFITLQKIAFGQKKFEFRAQVQKCHFGNFSIFAKMALLNPCMKLNFFLAKSILLKQYENDNKKKIHNMSQGPPNSGFMQEKVQKGDSLKKPSRELKNYFCFRFL